MIISVFGACIFRIVWIYTIFAANPTLEILYLSYPISWIITPIAHAITLVITYRKKCKKLAAT